MTPTSRDYRVGLFTFLGIVVLSVLILLYGEEPTIFIATHYDVAVAVDNPKNIGEGTPAFMQGVKVGRVREIRFQDDQLPSRGAAVIIAVDEKYDIPHGSKAVLHPAFGFDKGAIHVEPPGVPSEPLPRDDSAVIPGEMKGALASIVPEEFVPALVDAVEGIRQTFEEIGQLANKFGVVSEDLHMLLEVREMEVVDDANQDTSANLYTAVQRLDETLRSFNEFIDEGGDFRELAARLRDSAANLETWTANLDDRTDGLVTRADSTMQSIERRFDQISSRLLDVLGDLSGALDEVSGTVAAVRRGDGFLARAINDPQLYEELIDSLDQLQLLLDDLRGLSSWISTESRLAPGNL